MAAMIATRLTAAAAAALLCLGAARAQTLPAAEADLARGVWSALGRGEYVAAFELLERAACPQAQSGGAAPNPGMLKQLEPMLNGYAVPEPLNPSSPGLTAEEEARIRQVALADAIAEIRAAAGRTRIVIVNEAHHVPRDRAFALEVARALRPLGYSVLAAEAFGNPGGERMLAQMAELQRDGYPRHRTGFYTKDPVFGDFVRQALALGYQPVAYEHTEAQSTPNGGIAEREQAQAENLAAILRRMPDRKMLIFVGFSHVTEAPIPRADGQEEWMASRLKRMTGIDPVTVDQTVIAEGAAARNMREAYALLAARIRKPSIVKLGGGPYTTGAYRDAVDFQVVHPPLELVRGRPAWLKNMGRRLRPIPAHLLPTRGRRLVQAFLADEAQDAVPVEQVVVEAGKPPPGLMLPDKPIRFAVQDWSGQGCR